MWPRMQLRNPFLNFMSLYKRKHSDMDSIGVIMSGAQHWHSLTGQQRTEFKPSLDAVCGSGSAFGSVSASGCDDSAGDCLQDKTSSRKCSKRCTSGTDKYKGFLKFIRKFRETHGCLQPQKLVRKAAKAWLKLSESQKDIYRRKGSGSNRCGGCKRRKRSCQLEMEQKEEEYGLDFMLEMN